ncbi:MAG: carbohydrate porin [Limnobacter sp.]|nr:carbohydrate porin [Limnobacter sp.]
MNATLTLGHALLALAVGVPAAALAASETSRWQDVSVGASLLAVGQNLSASPSVAGRNDSQLNYRADLEIELPLGEFPGSGTQGILFTHFRAGQGSGVTPSATTFTGAVNSTTFALAGTQDEYKALLAQMWYQLSTPVGGQPQADRFQFILGKIDPFVFFDNNAIADDESEGFLNNVFVHNPHLDSGGDIGADDYGFTPGLVATYMHSAEPSKQWQVSLGVFGASNGASFQNSLSDPFTIAQLQYSGSALFGQEGTYQTYVWNNPQAENALTAQTESHTGIGVSLSQQLGDTLAVFSRLGSQIKGTVNFDRSVTAGVQWNGDSWGRNQDRIGFAAGALFASDEYKQANAGAKSAETQAELFYTYQVNDNLHVSPHVIHISNPGALTTQSDVTVVGVRTKAAF